jgi:hypothetical protein
VTGRPGVGEAGLSALVGRVEAGLSAVVGRVASCSMEVGAAIGNGGPPPSPVDARSSLIRPALMTATPAAAVALMIHCLRRRRTR